MAAMATVTVKITKRYKYGKPKRAKIESRYTAPFPLGSRPVNINKEVGITFTNNNSIAASDQTAIAGYT